MTTQPPQFTASQYLQAARRAEAEGRTDYALQFYRHLAEHYPGTVEAEEGRSGLARLGDWRRSAQVAQPAPPPPQAPTGPHPHAPMESPASYRPMAETHTYHHPPAVQTHHAQHEHEKVALPRAIARHDPALAGAIPGPYDDYYLSRWIVRLVGWLGWLMLLVGLALTAIVVAGALGDKRVLAAFATLPMLSWLGPALLSAGAVIALLSQLTRAAFDTANAARDLAAIERAKAEL